MNYTCNNCGRVAFGVTREFAEEGVVEFNGYYNKLPEDTKLEWYGGKPASIEIYERCIECGNGYDNFRPAVDGDCPDGCTISPIIVEGE